MQAGADRHWISEAIRLNGRACRGGERISIRRQTRNNITATRICNVALSGRHAHDNSLQRQTLNRIHHTFDEKRARRAAHLNHIVRCGAETFHIRNGALHNIEASRRPAFAGDRAVRGRRRSIAPIPKVGQRVAIRIAGVTGKGDAAIDRGVGIGCAKSRQRREIAGNVATSRRDIDPVHAVRIRAARHRGDVNSCRSVGEGHADRQDRIGLLRGIRLHVEQQWLLVAAVDIGPVQQYAVSHAVVRAIELTMFDPVIIRVAGALHDERPLVSVGLDLVHGADARSSGAIGRDLHHV